MDHPCHMCGHVIEDGKPFCPQCGAPQIRVTTAEPSVWPGAADVLAHNVPTFSPTPPDSLRPLAALSAGIEWSQGLRACAVAALVSLVVMALRLMVPLLAILCAGCLAVILYRHRHPVWKANARSGARLGAVTALFSSAVMAVFSAASFAVLQTGGQVRQQVLDALQQMVSRSNDPQMQATLDLLKQPEGLGTKLILAMAGFFLLSIAASSLAGALTGAFLGRRNRP